MYEFEALLKYSGEPVTVQYEYDEPDESVGYAEGFNLTVLNEDGKDITDEITQDDYVSLERKAKDDYYTSSPEDND